MEQLPRTGRSTKASADHDPKAVSRSYNRFSNDSPFGIIAGGKVLS